MKNSLSITRIEILKMALETPDDWGMIYFDATFTDFVIASNSNMNSSYSEPVSKNEILIEIFTRDKNEYMKVHNITEDEFNSQHHQVLFTIGRIS